MPTAPLLRDDNEDWTWQVTAATSAPTPQTVSTVPMNRTDYTVE